MAWFALFPIIVSTVWKKCKETETRGSCWGYRRPSTHSRNQYLLFSARSSTTRPLQNNLKRTAHVHVSDQTVRNKLHEGTVRARCPLVGPVLTDQHCSAHLAFVREHQSWQQYQTNTCPFPVITHHLLWKT